MLRGNSQHIAKWVIIVVLFWSSLCLWFLGSQDFRFQRVPDSLDLSELATDAEPWQRKGKSGNVDLTADGIVLELQKRKKLQVRLYKHFDWDADVAAGSTHLLVSGKMERLSDFTHHRRFSDRPAFSIRLRDDGSRNGIGMVSRARGTQQAEQFVELIKPTSGSDELQIFWRIFVPGEWRLSDLQIRAVTESPIYRVLLMALLAQLFCLGLFVVYALFSKLKLWQSAGFSIAAAVTITFAMAAQATVGEIRSLVMQIFPGGAIHFFEMQKAGHVIAFMVLAFIAMKFHRRLHTTYYEVAAFLFALALLTEALQRHSVGRSPRLMDIGYDAAGIVLGFIIYWLLARNWRGGRGTFRLSGRWVRLKSAGHRGRHRSHRMM